MRLDFVPYGLPPGRSGKRWIEMVEGSPSGPVWGCWLGHFDGKHDLLLIGTFPVALFNEMMSDPAEDPLREVAYQAVFVLVNNLMASGEKLSSPIELIESVARSPAQWKPTTWNIEAEPTRARTWTYDRLWWCGYCVTDVGMYVIMVGQGGDVEAAHKIVAVAETSAYGADSLCSTTPSALPPPYRPNSWA